jgi:hypothetical protein
MIGWGRFVVRESYIGESGGSSVGGAGSLKKYLFLWVKE